MTRRASSFVLVLLSTCAIAAVGPKETPVGLILNPGAGKLLRANTQTAIGAKAGDILFAGDAIRTEAGAATLLYCPAKTAATLAASSEVILEAAKLRVKTGSLADQKPVASCLLPQAARLSAASQQHYGVSLTRDLKTPGAGPAPEPVPPEIQTRLAAIGPGGDAAAAIARAAVFEGAGLHANALAEYRKAGTEFDGAVWIKGKIFELEETIANKPITAAQSGGRTFALLFGVSQYQKLPQELWLQYAHRDAEQFAAHLASPRGGAVPAENILVLTNEKATTAAVRNAFETFLEGKAGKNDTIFVLLAGHGTVQNPGDRRAYILTYDSDPQDLASTALPMDDVEAVIGKKLTQVGRVVLFVDVCRAGVIGTIRSTTVNGSVERLADAEGEIFGLMASRPKELSFEGTQWGNGHGAFSYYLLKGLSGDADKNADSIVNVNEIIDYVRTQVPESTGDKQHPRDFGNIANSFQLADVKKDGVTLARGAVMVGGEPALLASTVPVAFAAQAAQPSPADAAFAAALAAGRLLPGGAGSAFEALDRVSRELPPAVYADRKNQLRVALEDKAQQVLLRYLTGDEAAQTRRDFEDGARYTQAALRLTPESLFLQGRLAFFDGRATLFDKRYPDAAGKLEDAVRYDPNGAYSYNALGIGYLEQARFAEAAAAFRDSVSRAVHWAYPRHNLALALTEMSDYRAAIREYREAMRVAPTFSYIPYNLGLLYQRLNRFKDAESAFRQAIELAPSSPEPSNALGTLFASRNKPREAERAFRDALARREDHLLARHNLAVLLQDSPSRGSEAIGLLRDNLARQPDYLPSLDALGALLAASGADAEAIAVYRRVVAQRPERLAARISLARLLSGAGDLAGAGVELDAAELLSPRNADVLELRGDLMLARGDRSAAAGLYRDVLDLPIAKDQKKRVRGKLGNAGR
ncbi:MAG: caspase family protein [Bryobacteraceae bacterium]